MSAAATLLDCYAQIEANGERRLSAARHDDWDSVERLQRELGPLIDRCRGLAAATPLAREEQRERLRIMARIVRADAQLRRLESPELAAFEQRVFPAPRTRDRASA